MDQNYHTKLGISFVTNSEFSLKKLTPTNLPNANVALDVYLLRGQEVLITKNFHDEDELRNMLFSGFSNLISRTFSQTIVPTKQDFNQVLVLQDKIFKFVPLSSPLTYAVNSTIELAQVFEIVTQIIDKEQKILDQLLAFRNMLIQTSVFEAGDAPFSVAQDEPPAPQGRLTRDISGFFSPYSLTEIGQTASKNYKRMNRNFHAIGVTERRLSHDQNVLAQKFSEITVVEKTLLRKSLFIEFRSFTQSHFNDYMFKLTQIYQHAKLHKTYDILFALLRDTQFCQFSECFSNPIFTIIKPSTITASVTTLKQSLAKAVYISCTILPNYRTSIYSHTIALLNPQNELHFQQDKLPSLKLQDLVNPQKIEIQTRNLIPSDFVSEEFYPIYSHEKISLHCVVPKMIQINNQDTYCDLNNLNFRTIPDSITVNGKAILTETIPAHLATKLDFMNNDLRSISVFTQTNNTQMHFGQQIHTFFQNATPLHYSFLATILVLSVLFCFILTCICYFKLPKLLFKLLCCCNPTNFCKRKLQSRILDIDQLVTYRNLIRNEGQNQPFLPDAPSQNPAADSIQVIRPPFQDPPILRPPPYNFPYPS